MALLGARRPRLRLEANRRRDFGGADLGFI